MERANTRTPSKGKQTSTETWFRTYQRHRDGGGREAEEAVMAKVAFRLLRANQSRGRRHMRARPSPNRKVYRQRDSMGKTRLAIEGVASDLWFIMDRLRWFFEYCPNLALTLVVIYLPVTQSLVAGLSIPCYSIRLACLVDALCTDQLILLGLRGFRALFI